MRGHRSDHGGRSARITGVILALVAVTAVAVVSRIPGGTGTLGADVTFITGPTGELAVSQTGAVLQLNGLEPAGGPTKTGLFTVTNIASKTLSIRLRALPSIGDLDTLLSVRVTAGGGDLFDGTLSGLTAGSPLSFRLGSGRSTELVVAAWLPTSVTTGYQNRIDDVTLQFEPRGS